MAKIMGKTVRAFDYVQALPDSFSEGIADKALMNAFAAGCQLVDAKMIAYGVIKMYLPNTNDDDEPDGFDRSYLLNLILKEGSASLIEGAEENVKNQLFRVWNDSQWDAIAGDDVLEGATSYLHALRDVYSTSKAALTELEGMC